MVPLFGKKKGGKSSGILKNYEKLVEDALDAVKRGDEDKAILSLRKLLRWVTEDLDKITKMPTSDKNKLSELLTDAGETLIKLKEYDVAIKILEKAKTINPKNFRAWMDIGKDLLQRNTQVPYALVCLREASKIEPSNVEVHLLLGDAYRIQGQLDKALASYQKALKVDPDNEEALQKVLKIQPENIDILEKYIKILESKGNKEELVKAYNKIVSITGDMNYLERGLQLDPENKDLLMNKARILLREEKTEEAKEIVIKLKEMYPDDADIKMLHDELVPPETTEGPKEEVQEIEVGELFGDISLGEEPEVGFEEEGTMMIEGSEAAEEKEIKEEKEEATPKPTAPEMGAAAAATAGAIAGEIEKEEKKEEAPTPAPVEAPEGEIKEEKEIPQEVEVPEETVPPVEEVVPQEMPEEEVKEEIPSITPEPEKPKEEEAVVEKPEEKIPPEDEFLQLYGMGKRDEAAEFLNSMSDEDVEKLLNENDHILRFIYEHLVENKRLELALKFIDALIGKEASEQNLIEKAKVLIELGNMDEAEKVLNEVMKKNVKNGMAMYLKARIKSIQGVDIGVKNFLTMAMKFAPELKESAREDPYLEKYREQDWFKKITS